MSSLGLSFSINKMGLGGDGWTVLLRALSIANVLGFQNTLGTPMMSKAFKATCAPIHRPATEGRCTPAPPCPLVSSLAQGMLIDLGASLHLAPTSSALSPQPRRGPRPALQPLPAPRPPQRCRVHPGGRHSRFINHFHIRAGRGCLRSSHPRGAGTLTGHSGRI